MAFCGYAASNNPGKGSRLSCIENNTATDIVADLTIEAVLPDGTSYPVMELPVGVLAGASVRTRIGVAQEVPAAAPAGTYTYRVSASLGDTLLVDTAELRPRWPSSCPPQER
ncbi:hypothetical protein KJ682_05975 [bacterium]|nr:hypothetical protein [bacterium]